MPGRQIIDVHCHLFNAQYAFMEFFEATWKYLDGNYPHQVSASRKRETLGAIESIPGAKKFLVWILKLFEVALSDCEGNYDTALENFAQSSLGKMSSLVVTPLMMDIYFALDDNKDEKELRRRGWRPAPVVEPFIIPDNQKKRFDAHFNRIKNLLLEEIQRLPAIKRRSFSDQTLDSFFEDAKKELLTIPKKLRKDIDYEGIELSKGYKKHLHDLEVLCKKNPNKVFPFLAVDPRRIGIMKLIDMKVNKGKGIFKGVKLYPPLGYLPTHPNLQPIFEYCSTYDVPITLHCSEGGLQNFRSENYVKSWEGNNHLEDFKTSDGNKSRYYTAPEKWLPVLTKWSKLRLDFAHFGGGDKFYSGDTGWIDGIIKMMQKHKYVYADISYYSKPGLAQKISSLVNQNEILNTRLMFGTDYIMVMLDEELGGLDKYFDLFTSLNYKLLCNNAKNFLKIK